ncbi:MAG: hypothetical protein AABY00_01380 [Nanoarchaeota archaeon]
MVVSPIEGKRVILDVFADEAVSNREEMNIYDAFKVLQTLGFKYWTPRFARNPYSNQVENLCITSDERWLKEVKKVAEEEHSLSVVCMGAPSLKCKTVDAADANIKAKYMNRQAVIEQTKRVVQNAKEFGASAIRGFSTYQIIGGHPEDTFERAIENVYEVADLCKQNQLLYILEPETGL